MFFIEYPVCLGEFYNWVFRIIFPLLIGSLLVLWNDCSVFCLMVTQNRGTAVLSNRYFCSNIRSVAVEEVDLKEAYNECGKQESHNVHFPGLSSAEQPTQLLLQRIWPMVFWLADPALEPSEAQECMRKNCFLIYNLNRILY